VSWLELFANRAPSVVRSNVERERFGIEVDRLVVPRGSSAGSEEIVQLVEASKADVLVMRYPAERVGLFADLLGTGRAVLLADTLVYWELSVGAGRRPVRNDAFVMDVRALDPVAVEGLVADVFADYTNHYLANPIFDQRLALAGYQDWAVRSTSTHPPVLVLRDDVAIALATVELFEQVLEIELAGVVGHEQGRGVYTHLLAGVEDLAARKGRTRVVISTQAHNTNVQRAWARYGFEPVATFTTVHVMSPREKLT
jgi:GNAT superfamily N-acetyltransferase